MKPSVVAVAGLSRKRGGGEVAYRGSVQSPPTIYGYISVAPEITPSAGDMLLSVVYKKSASASTIVAPTSAGLTFLNAFNTSLLNETCMSVWYAFVPDSAPRTVQFNGTNQSANKTMFGHLAAFSGVDSADPFDVGLAVGQVSTYTVPSVTTLTPGAMVIATAMCSQDFSLTVGSPDWVQYGNTVANLTASNPDCAGTSCYLSMPDAGSTGDLSLVGGSGYAGQVASFALKAES